ncbi:hypothetical protein Tco_0722224 [Tanacetum coccineum]
MIDVIKNSTCFKAFTISADVPEIFMQQFWYTIKKVQCTDSYEFLLANKKCRVDAEVFRKILDICPRVEGKEFIELQNDDDTFAFLLDLGYKGPLHKYTNMYVDHMNQPWRNLEAIINKSLSGKTASNDRLRKSRIDIMWGMFYKENEYGLEIPDVMLNDTIKRSESYQMFIKYSTGQISPKKSRGKGSQGKKTVDDTQETVDVSEESEPVKKKTASKRVVKKKVTLFVDDNIIPDDLDAALELGKSISLTEAEEVEAARKVHATHARIMTESVPESAKKKSGGRSSRGVTIQDTPSDPKPKPTTLKPKIKGAQSLNLVEKEVADIMQALKESKKTSKRHPGTEGSSEGTGTIPRVPDESTVVSATSSVGTEQESEYSEEDQLDDEEKDDKESDDDDKGDDHISDTKDTDDETESDEDDIYKYKIRVHKDEDEEMLNAKVEDSRKGDAEVSDAAKADAENTEEAKDDSKKAKLPSTSSSLSISSGFGDQFLKLSSDTSLVGTSPSVLRVLVYVISETTVLIPVQETSLAALVTTLHLPYVSTTPPAPQQTTTPIPTPPITTDAPTITTAILEFDALFAVQLRVAKLEKDVFELKNADHSVATIATLKS